MFTEDAAYSAAHANVHSYSYSLTSQGAVTLPKDTVTFTGMLLS